MEKQVGKTKDVGFQFGLRRTFPIQTEKAWEYLFSPIGLAIWLGELETEFELKKDFCTKKRNKWIPKGVQGIFACSTKLEEKRMG